MNKKNMKPFDSAQGKPLISVIMSVYNAEKYVAAAIQSIQSQTVTDWEFLIVDDASTDTTPEILKNFAATDKRIKVYTNKSNSGLSDCLNLVIPKTRGQFIVRMDADDVSLPARFAKQLEYLKNHPEVVACGTQEELMDKNGEHIGYKRFPTNPADCYNLLFLVMPIQPPTLLARAEEFKKCRYDETNDDISVFFQLLKFGSLSNIPDFVFKYRVSETSTTHKDIKATYKMAFDTRMKAIRNGAYKPALTYLPLFALEWIVVQLLPNQLIMKVFEILRHQSGQKPNTLTQNKLADF